MYTIASTNDIWEDFREVLNLKKPLDESKLPTLRFRSIGFIRSIMNIPGIRNISISATELDIYLRPGYHWHEVDNGIVEAFKKWYPDAKLI